MEHIAAVDIQKDGAQACAQEFPSGAVKASAVEDDPQSAVIAAIAKVKQKIRRQKRKAKKVRQYFEAKEAGRKAYAMADRLLDEIADETRAGSEIQLFDADGNPGEKARLVDQFAEKSIVWKPCGVRRYDLVMVK